MHTELIIRDENNDEGHYCSVNFEDFAPADDGRLGSNGPFSAAGAGSYN